MTRLIVLHRGLRAAEREVDDITGRLRHLEPAVPMIRRRWMEGEERAFSSNRFRRRKASTRARYARRGVRSGLGRDRRPVASPGGQTLVLSGRLRRALTTEDAPGQLDDSRSTASGVRMRFGAKPKGKPGPKPRGPVAYAHLLARRGRNPVVIDRPAIADATDDVTDYILLGRTR